MNPLVERLIDSPIGTLRLVATADALCELTFAEHPRRCPRLPARGAARHDVLDLAERELEDYFAGTLRAFTTPAAPEGTAFQREVWAALTTIPFGETRSYADVARAIGRPRAVRAVGGANGDNPLSLLQPCHRVIGARGALTGYAGGLERKRWLLAHEQASARPAADS